MTKEVLVSVRGLQFVDSEVSQAASDEELDQIETICPGEYYYRNNAHYILYEENMEEVPEPVSNMIKLRDKEFCLWKIKRERIFAMEERSCQCADGVFRGEKNHDRLFYPVRKYSDRDGYPGSLRDRERGLYQNTYFLWIGSELSVHRRL